MRRQLDELFENPPPAPPIPNVATYHPGTYNEAFYFDTVEEAGEFRTSAAALKLRMHQCAALSSVRCQYAMSHKMTFMASLALSRMKSLKSNVV